MSEHPSEGKTKLSLDLKMNYGRVSNHLKWMEKKGLVVSLIEDGKIKIALTGNGRILVSTRLITYTNSLPLQFSHWEKTRYFLPNQ
jgi:DNA-binding transcriptional ArsR family regulator